MSASVRQKDSELINRPPEEWELLRPIIDPRVLPACYQFGPGSFVCHVRIGLKLPPVWT